MESCVGPSLPSRAKARPSAGTSWKRVDQPTALLLKLNEHIARWGMNKTAREVARTLCSYFDEEFSHHRENQESGLFPALRARAQAEDRDRLEAAFAQLVAEHRDIEQSWAALREALTEIALCRPAKLSADTVGRFALLYRDHVKSEDERLMTLAAQAFGVDPGITGSADRPSRSPCLKQRGENSFSGIR
jgi:hypothetical protein